MKHLKLVSKLITAILVLLFSSISLFAQDIDDKDNLKEQQKKLESANDFVYEGNELLQEEDFISAEKEYRRALSKQDNNVAGNYNLGHSYYDKGNYDEALFRLSEAAKAAETKSEKHQAFHNLGNAFMKKEECEKAVEAFKNALRSNPSDDETRYNYVLAKDCMEKQQQDQKNDQNDQDDDKDKEKEKNDDESEDKKEQEQNEEQQDKKDQDQNDGDNEDENKGDQKEDNKEKNQGEDENKNPQKPKPQEGKLSPQQIKSLLEAMNNQEQKVQEKMNAEKQKGVRVKTEKDW